MDLSDFVGLRANFGNTLRAPAPAATLETIPSSAKTQTVAEPSIDLLAEPGISDDEAVSVGDDVLRIEASVLLFPAALSYPARQPVSAIGSEVTDSTTRTTYLAATAANDLRPLSDDLLTDGGSDLLADILAESPLAIPL